MIESQPVELLASCWTTAGNAGPTRGLERSLFALPARIEAAARAGYRGFGIVHADLVAAEVAYGFEGITAMLESNGMVHLELEMLGDWFATGERRKASDRVRHDLLRAAERLHPRQIKCGGETDGHAWPWDQLVEDFAELCRQAADAGTRIALEPMPFGQIKDPAVGRRLVDAAGQASGGLIVDLWHVARGGVDLAEIRQLPARYIFAVELDDADDEVHGATLWDDTVDFRRLCGEGDLDVAGFIAAIQAAGYAGPWGVEILSEEFRHLPLEEQASCSFRTAMSMFDTG
jgi:sugar phosphate isomerase/epimerase